MYERTDKGVVVTNLDVLKQAALTSEKAAKELSDWESKAVVPARCKHVWRVFLDMQERRQSSGFGPVPFSWSDVAAYQKLYGIKLSPGEIMLLGVAEMAYLDAVHGELKKDKPK